MNIIEQIASMTWRNPLFMLVFFSALWYLPGLILRRRKYILDEKNRIDKQRKRIASLYPKDIDKK